MPGRTGKTPLIPLLAATSAVISVTVVTAVVDESDGRGIYVGRVDELRAEIEAPRATPLPHPAGFYLAPYPARGLREALRVYPAALRPGLRAGLVALDWRSTHLGHPVGFCTSSRWFEEPTHGSKWNGVGEKQSGPAPRGLDHFVVRVDEEGRVFVDVESIVEGMPIGTDTVDQEPAGPHCA